MLFKGRSLVNFGSGKILRNTGEPFTFADWGPSEPFGNGNHISYAKWGSLVAWNDIPSVHTVIPYGYILETAVPEPSSIILVLSVCLIVILLCQRRTEIVK